MQNPVSWDYLTAPLRETPTWGPFSIFYVVLFGLAFTTAMFMYYDAPRRFHDHKLNRDLVRVATQWVMWVTAIGLIFFVIRAMRFEFITMHLRIWLYLSLLAFLGMFGYFVYYARTTYPARLDAFERNRSRRKYITAAVGRNSSRSKPRRTEPGRRRRTVR